MKRLLCRKSSLRIGKVNIFGLIINKARKCILNEIVQETSSHTRRSSKPVIPKQQESLSGEVGIGGRWGAAELKKLAG